jgi:MFS family permease
VGTQLPRGYRVWVGAATVSQVGDAVVYFALGWAASAHGGVAAGLVLACITVPRTALMLFGGAVADRLGPRTVMLAADVLLLAGSAVAAVLVAVVGAPLGLLVAAALVLGTVTSFYGPASGSLPARLVEPAVLPRALALRNAGFQFASLTGGPLGGLLVALAGIGAALGVNAASYLLVLAVMLRLRPAVPAVPGSRGSLIREMADGLRVAARVPALRLVLLLYALAGGFVLPIGSLLVPLLARERAWDAASAGLVTGALSAGALAAALVVTRTGTHHRVGLLAGAGLVGTAAGSAVLAVGPAVAAGIAGALLAGVGLGVFIAHAGPLVVVATPDTHLSRVQALLGVVQSAALIGTNLVLGALARIGPAVAVLAAAGVIVAAGVLAALHPALRGRTPAPA